MAAKPTDGGRTDDELTLSDAVNIEEEISEGKPVIEGPPISCPRCGRELEHGPYGTWVCFRCPDRVAIRERGGRR
jgi:DNA-directed RNA polymerase subunit RPC12/RpoP